MPGYKKLYLPADSFQVLEDALVYKLDKRNKNVVALCRLHLYFKEWHCEVAAFFVGHLYWTCVGTKELRLAHGQLNLPLDVPLRT